MTTFVLIGGGKSAAYADLSILRGAHVIVINESWRLWPWAQTLYACDAAWWAVRGPSAAEFRGRRISGEPYPGIEQAPIALDGGNSGFQAVSLAIHLRATRIILVGFDYAGEHWHGRHPTGLNNPTDELLATWAVNLDARAEILAAGGVEVINASPCSALRAFPVQTLQEAIA